MRAAGTLVVPERTPSASVKLVHLSAHDSCFDKGLGGVAVHGYERSAFRHYEDGRRALATTVARQLITSLQRMVSTAAKAGELGFESWRDVHPCPIARRYRLRQSRHGA